MSKIVHFLIFCIQQIFYIHAILKINAKHQEGLFMSILFYPQDDLIESASLDEKLEVLKEAAEQYKAAVLGSTESAALTKCSTPREIKMAFNWQDIAKLLREVREMTEANSDTKAIKEKALTKLADIYEVLRGAKMPKLETVRVMLIEEVKLLHG
jgi:hypothetical protein